METKFKKNAKVEIQWNVNPYDYSQEVQNGIAEKFSKKHGIPKEKIKVIPNFITKDEDGNEISFTRDVVKDINDPKFQVQLFKEYMKVNDCDMDSLPAIERIDSEINDRIDYNRFVSNKRFSLKWMKWDNFLSYGKGNYFDFSSMKGLVLLHGEAPYQNQSGKTTFAIDLSHFLFFGRTTKTENLSQIFNKRLPDETEVNVEGCIVIDGEEYVIKRTITRPKRENRTAKSKVIQKVSYYKIVGGTYEELEDYEEENGASVQETNKIIKEAIGTEQDYDLMLCATSSNLDDLISMKDADRGRLLTRWIGLSVIEQKDTVARQVFNGSVKPKLLCNVYDRETLSNEVKAYEKDIDEKKAEMERSQNRIEVLTKELEGFELQKRTLHEAKSTVDDKLTKIDVTTLQRSFDDLVEEGKSQKAKIDTISAKVTELGNVSFDAKDLRDRHEEKTNIVRDLAQMEARYKANKKLIVDLLNSEVCPTCGRKYDNVDNSRKIEEIKKENEEILAGYNQLKERMTVVDKEIEELNVLQEKFNEKNRLVILHGTLLSKLERMRADCIEKRNLMREYNKNLDAIKKNNELDISIRNVDINIRARKDEMDRLNSNVTYNKVTIATEEKEIEKRNDIIRKITEENELMKAWKIYLAMVGKNGISKMVLRKALPLINADLASMLSDVCDFSVTVEITDKQEVMFYLVTDGIRSNLSSGSGFEMTCASLALRSVLSKMSMLTKSDFLVLDEILGRVSSANYDNMKLLYDKIMTDYRFVIQVTHIEEVKDWHDRILCVSKKDGISRILIEK